MGEALDHCRLAYARAAAHTAKPNLRLGMVRETFPQGVALRGCIPAAHGGSAVVARSRDGGRLQWSTWHQVCTWLPARKASVSIGNSIASVSIRSSRL